MKTQNSVINTLQNEILTRIETRISQCENKDLTQDSSLSTLKTELTNKISTVENELDGKITNVKSEITSEITEVKTDILSTVKL